MELHHSFRVPIGIDEAWTTFNDLERIAPCLPGAQLTSLDGDDFTGKAKVKVGPVSMQFAGSGRFVERDEAGYRAVIEATGKDSRGNGTAAATVTARLEADGDSTNVLVDTDLKVSGKVAQFGKGMISEIGGKLLDQFAACLADTLGAPAAETVPAAPVGETTGASPSVQDVEPADLRPAGAGDVAAPDAAVPSATPPGGPTASTTGTTTPLPPRRPMAPQAEPVALDLGSVLLPTLLRRFGPLVAAGLVGGLVGWLLGRRGAGS